MIERLTVISAKLEIYKTTNEQHAVFVEFGHNSERELTSGAGKRLALLSESPLDVVGGKYRVHKNLLTVLAAYKNIACSVHKMSNSLKAPRKIT